MVVEARLSLCVFLVYFWCEFKFYINIYIYIFISIYINMYIYMSIYTIYIYGLNRSDLAAPMQTFELRHMVQLQQTCGVWQRYKLIGGYEWR